MLHAAKKKKEMDFHFFSVILCNITRSQTDSSETG